MAEQQRLIPVANFERKDVPRWFIWAAVALCSAVLLGCALLVHRLYPTSTSNQAIPQPLALYPAPRLQSDPVADLADLRRRELQRLDSLGWVDKAHGIVHVPIAQAMQETLREGIAGWPEAATAAPSPAEDRSGMP